MRSASKSGPKTVPTTPRPLLVGEANPYGEDPRFALYPLPERASGGRLARILGLTARDYLRAFDRINLCPGRWSMRQARARVDLLLADPATRQRPALILLGRKVSTAFGFPLAYFWTEVPPAPPLPPAYLIPHPSGLNQTWNDPGAVERTRSLLAQFLPAARAALKEQP